MITEVDIYYCIWVVATSCCLPINHRLPVFVWAQ